MGGVGGACQQVQTDPAPSLISSVIFLCTATRPPNARFLAMTRVSGQALALRWECFCDVDSLETCPRHHGAPQYCVTPKEREALEFYWHELNRALRDLAECKAMPGDADPGTSRVI